MNCYDIVGVRLYLYHRMSRPTTRSKNKRQKQGDDGVCANETWRYFRLFLCLVCEFKSLFSNGLCYYICPSIFVGKFTKPVLLLKMMLISCI